MDEEIRHIDLCSGIGGFALAAGWAGSRANRNVRTVAFSEIDPFCQAVLRHHWPGVPVIDDLRKFDYEGGCDLVTAGYPCQPFSVAGKQKGAADDRHLWPHVFEIVKRKRPAWCLFENVTGHITLGLDEVLLDLENEGYAARPLVVPACSKNAPHRRDRVWIVAYADRAGQCTGQGGGQNCQNKARHDAGRSSASGRPQEWWAVEPNVCRVATGVPNRVAQLRALGNAIVPQVAAEILEAMFRNWDHV